MLKEEEEKTANLKPGSIKGPSLNNSEMCSQLPTIADGIEPILEDRKAKAIPPDPEQPLHNSESLQQFGNPNQWILSRGPE